MKNDRSGGSTHAGTGGAGAGDPNPLDPDAGIFDATDAAAPAGMCAECDGFICK